MSFPSIDNGEGMPDWATSARFDITAKVTPGTGNASSDQSPAMMQALLADRFKLKTHYETREFPAYELVMDRSDGTLGPQMKPSDVDCAAPAATASPSSPPSPTAGACHAAGPGSSPTGSRAT